jgi:hypothetical protein
MWHKPKYKSLLEGRVNPKVILWNIKLIYKGNITKDSVISIKGDRWDNLLNQVDFFDKSSIFTVTLLIPV